MNAEAETEAVELLAASAGERLLVIGFGPGLGLEILARLCPDTMITGVDPSASMLRSAERRNRAVISAGRMTLHQTTVAGGWKHRLVGSMRQSPSTSCSSSSHLRMRP
jgi:trans-aconitate methyltransferase